MRSAWIILVGLILFLSSFHLFITDASETEKESSSAAALSTSRPIEATAENRATPVGNQEQSGHPLDSVLQMARDALKKFDGSINDYTATLLKRERIAGTLGAETKMEIKVRTRKMQGESLVSPLHVYLKFEQPWLAAGREVIWVENANDGKLVGHEGGLKNLFRVNLAPTDSLAMMGNKYPITEIGLARLVEKLIEKGERDKQLGPCEVLIEDGHVVGDRPCQLIQVKHPQRDDRFEFYTAQIFFDKERMIPLRYAAFLWPETADAAPPLEEEYTYLNVRLNVNLTDTDFDPNNPAYNFPK